MSAGHFPPRTGVRTAATAAEGHTLSRGRTAATASAAVGGAASTRGLCRRRCTRPPQQSLQFPRPAAMEVGFRTCRGLPTHRCVSNQNYFNFPNTNYAHNHYARHKIAKNRIIYYDSKIENHSKLIIHKNCVSLIFTPRHRKFTTTKNNNLR